MNVSSNHPITIWLCHIGQHEHGGMLFYLTPISQSFTNSLRGTLDRHSGPVEPMRMLSVISNPQSSIHNPVMKWNVMFSWSTVLSPGRNDIVRSPQSGGYDNPMGYPVRLLFYRIF